MRRRIVIVGGGVTGVAVFLAAVRHRIADRIDIVDPLPPGAGIAFANQNPALLCNTSVGIMSVIHDQPHDFLRYLTDHGSSVTADDFVARRDFGEYVRSRYAQQVTRHLAAGGSHRHIGSRATVVRQDGIAGYHVEMDDGRVVPATDVLVCRGYGEPVVPDVLTPHLDHDLAFRSPFPEAALLRSLPPHARVLVLGTRLSGIDAALLLCAAGHTVTMASPSGQLPAVRTRTGRGGAGLVRPTDIAALDFADPGVRHDILALVHKATSTFSPRSLRKQTTSITDTTRRLCAEIRLAEQGHTDWQDVLCSMVDAWNEVLTQQDRSTWDTLLRRCDRWFSRYLAAFPLSNAKTLLTHITSRRLRIRAGVPAALRAGRPWLARWPEGTAESFDAVVSAAGYSLPRPHVRPGALHLTSCPSVPRQPAVEPDLRVTLPGSPRPDRIWLLGINSAVRVPSINAIYPMVQQADRICRQLHHHAQDDVTNAPNSVDRLLISTSTRLPG